jgi:putative transposase
MTTRDIMVHIQETHWVEVYRALVSQVTDAVTEEITPWQNRPHDEVYPVISLDAVRVKVRPQWPGW